MLPPSLLTQLSPNACKVYLTLLTHFHPARPAPVKLPMQSLSALAPRSCSRALSELAAAKLLRRLPFHYHHRSYVLLPIPPLPKTDQPPQASLLNPPAPPTDRPPQAGHAPPVFTREMIREEYAKFTPEQKVEFLTLIDDHVERVSRPARPAE